MNWSDLKISDLDSRHVLDTPRMVDEWPESGKQGGDPSVAYYGIPYGEAPPMLYWYPCQILNPKYAAEKLEGVPLCVVDWLNRDERGLALTGGGMDHSWSICEAYIILGYLPPVHFIPPPDYGEYGVKQKKILAAMTRSTKVAKEWMQSRLESVQRMREKYGS